MSSEPDVDTLGIKALRELISSAGLSYEDCIEKSDLRVRAGEALKRGSSSSGGGRPLHRNLYFYNIFLFFYLYQKFQVWF